jgi:hypothetical protein
VLSEIARAGERDDLPLWTPVGALLRVLTIATRVTRVLEIRRHRLSGPDMAAQDGMLITMARRVPREDRATTSRKPA